MFRLKRKHDKKKHKNNGKSIKTEIKTKQKKLKKYNRVFLIFLIADNNNIFAVQNIVSFSKTFCVPKDATVENHYKITI